VKYKTYFSDQENIIAGFMVYLRGLMRFLGVIAIVEVKDIIKIKKLISNKIQWGNFKVFQGFTVTVNIREIMRNKKITFLQNQHSRNKVG